MTALPLGIRENRVQFTHQLIQVLLVGFAIGMMRTVIPALAETEFGVARGSFLLLTAFVVAFGVVKAVMNFVAGRLSERIGRQQVLLWGWIIALPIPVMIWAAPNWGWIVAATVLLGVNQGLCWSMTQTSKLDITRADQRGLTMGLNEFSGYVGVALAGVVTAYVAEAMGARLGLLVFGLTVIGVALVLTVVWVKDTLPWAKAETAAHKISAPKFPPRYPHGVPEHPTTAEVFALMSWRDKRLAALSQAGLVEKFVDALVGDLSGVPGGPRCQFDRNGLDCRCIRLCLGWIATVYRAVVGSCRAVLAQCAGHVDQWGWCADGGVGRWCCMVGAVCGNCRFRHGAALP
jgi:MFS family permease